MLSLIVLVLIIISVGKPDILIPNKIKNKATLEEKQILAKNYRIIYLLIFGLLESTFLIEINEIFLILSVILLILVFKYSLPKCKKNKELIQNIKNRS